LNGGRDRSYRRSKKTACWPKKFQNHHGIARPIFWPAPFSVVALSIDREIVERAAQVVDCGHKTAYDMAG
jgi:hypothetical protein